MSNISEYWQDINEYEGLYQVSNCGRVKSLDRTVHYKNGKRHLHKGLILAPLPTHHGYVRVCLRKPDNIKYRFIHQLVLESFIGKSPLGYQVNHIDGNKQNNYVGNLEYITPSGNRHHAYQTGLQKPIRGIDHHNAKLTVAQVKEIRTLIGKIPQKDIANKFNVSPSSIGDIKFGRTWAYQ